VNDLELMRLELETGFTFDQRGRLVMTNEPVASARRRAPRVVLGRTSLGGIVRFRADVGDDVVRRIEAIVVYDGAADDDVRAALGDAEASGGPAFTFPDGLVTSGTLRLEASNRDLVRDTFPWLYDEIGNWQPTFGVVQDGAVVSVCFSSRLGTRAAAAGLETLADCRGRGYASAVTAAWGAAVRQAGLIPLYGTSWDNLASRGVARRLCLVAFGACTSWS
jgi:hypothetical protein